MLLYPDPFILDPERSFPPSQEVNSPSTIDPYCCYFLSSLPSSPSSFNYNFVFATDALPSNIALETSALPPPDPEAGEERAVPAPPAATKAGRHKRFRTDRHSKIVTSQGLRDRRMRLSLDVARQFFRLQEMLGFDKASHTIDWLLKESRSSIERLAASSRSNNRTLNSDRFITESSASTECEVVFRNSNHKLKPTAAASSKAKVLRPSREVASDPILFTRESREKARARARERTLEKKRIKSERSLSDAHKMDQLVPSKVTII